MESRFSADFNKVRVHTDSTAVQMNQQLGAQAFTHGSDIFYGEGKAPGKNKLTAHELTHVVQQGGKVQNLVQRETKKGDSSESTEKPPQIVANNNETVNDGEYISIYVVKAGRVPDTITFVSLKTGRIYKNKLYPSNDRFLVTKDSLSIVQRANGKIEEYQVNDYIICSIGDKLIQRAKNPEQGKSKNVLEIILGALMGEFNPNPSLAEIALDLGLNFIPGVDQVADTRDLAAHLYYMLFQGELSKLERWIGLGFTLIGFVPIIGSTLKSLNKVLTKGAKEALQSADEILAVINKLLPGIKIQELQKLITNNWNKGLLAGKKRWKDFLSWLKNKITDNVPENIISKIPGFEDIAEQKRKILSQLDQVLSLSDSLLDEAFAKIKSIIDEVFEELGKRIDPNGQLVTAGGPPLGNQLDEVRPGSKPMQITGSPGGTPTPNPALASKLSSELGVDVQYINQALQVIQPEDLRKLHSGLSQETFGILLKRSPSVIEKFSQAWKLVGNDTVGRQALINLLPPSKVLIPTNNLEQALTEILTFLQKYLGRASGDFPARFGRKFRPKTDPVDAANEIAFAQDFLEGKTARGNNLEVEGLVPRIENGKEVQNEKVPEFRVTTPSGDSFIAEVKTIQKPLSKNGIDRNLQTAIRQIKQLQGKRGYIRIDASQAPPTAISRNDIVNAVIDRLQDNDQRGIDFIEYVEVLYNDNLGNPQKLLFTVQKGQVVVSP